MGIRAYSIITAVLFMSIVTGPRNGAQTSNSEQNPVQQATKAATPEVSICGGSHYRRIGPAGQTGEMPFDDNPATPIDQSITQLIIHSGDVVNGLQACYGSPAIPGPAYGGTGGRLDRVMIPTGDVLTEVSGYTGTWFGGNYVLQLSFSTRNERTFGPFGSMAYSSARVPFKFRVQSNEQIVGFFGSASYGNNGREVFLGSLGVIVRADPSSQ